MQSNTINFNFSFHTIKIKFRNLRHLLTASYCLQNAFSSTFRNFTAIMHSISHPVSLYKTGTFIHAISAS